jgi:hypothetical protein
MLLWRIYVPGNNKTAITTPPVTIHNDTSHWDLILLDRTGWIDVSTHALHIMNTDIELRPLQLVTIMTTIISVTM